MYFVHTAGVRVFQNVAIPLTMESKFLGLFWVRKKYFNDPHTFSIGFKSGLSAGVFHRMILHV